MARNNRNARLCPSSLSMIQLHHDGQAVKPAREQQTEGEGRYAGIESVRPRQRQPRVREYGHEAEKDWRSQPVLYKWEAHLREPGFFPFSARLLNRPLLSPLCCI
ncbi:MAG: hypothetical protein JSW47_00745 [Phycisphaerales bacterium]|nr:MAG: hypothetical protein JSW47_00745 [Phycisphaerales bacterium]